jgi:hypothetical protein
MGQEEWGNGVPIAIDRVDVGGVGRGRGRGRFIPCVLFETLVNAQMEVRLKE